MMISVTALVLCLTTLLHRCVAFSVLPPQTSRVSSSHLFETSLTEIATSDEEEDITVSEVAPPSPTTPPQQQQLEQQTPAEYENSKFDCDDSVEFWRNFQKDGLFEANENLREVVNVANRFASKGGDALSYWLVSKHVYSLSNLHFTIVVDPTSCSLTIVFSVTMLEPGTFSQMHYWVQLHQISTKEFAQKTSLKMDLPETCFVHKSFLVSY